MDTTWIVPPMLAEPIDTDSLALTLLQREGWRAEQKLDGVRLLIHIHDDSDGYPVVSGVNRKGEVTLIPKPITQAFSHLEGDWIFDGELIKGVYWVFDLVRAMNVVTPDTPYADRRFYLEEIWETLGLGDKVRLLPSYTDDVDRLELARVLKEANCEGMMLKDEAAAYVPGRRTRSVRKWKFYETADVIVLETWREGKRSMAVGLINPDTEELVNVGSVAMTPANLDRVKRFDVCEVKYLYVDDINEPRLYQPAFIRKRDDKDPYECLLSQLKITNKEVQA